MYYRLEESACPIAADSSGNGHHATYQASVQFGAAGALLGEADSAITRIGPVLKAGGVTFSFPAPSGGRLVIAWYLVPKGAHLSRSTKPKVVLVAHATRTISAARNVAIKVKLTSRGRALLKRATRITLTAKSSFTMPGRATVSVRLAFTVKR